MALAARTRVALLDKGHRGRGSIQNKAREIRNATNNRDKIDVLSHWYSWWAGNYTFNLERACHEVEKECGSIEQIRVQRKRGIEESGIDEDWRKECQSTLTRNLLASRVQNPVERIRRKLQRWALMDHSIHGTVPEGSNPRKNAERCNRNLQWIGSNLPPREGSAVFSTIWNRWTTKRRFQASGSCLLGCSERASDSIEHYCRCAVVQRVCRQFLNLDPRVYTGMHAFLLTHPGIVSKESLTALSLLIYSVYNVTNRLRANGPLSDGIYDALCQMCREGAKGSELAVRTLRERWLTQEEGRLPPVSDLPWTKATRNTRSKQQRRA